MQNRIQELETLIIKARNDYYNGTATVADEVFDAWVDELSELQANNSAVTAIGAPPTSAWPKVAHRSPMGSLTKVNLEEEFKAWLRSVSRGPNEVLVTSEKIDGLSIECVYEKGKLVQALTRGDGAIGEDITVNVLKMRGVVKQLPVAYTGSVRGEIVLYKEDLVKHFPDKSSTRNTASGTSKRLDGQGCEHLTILCYSISDCVDIHSEAAMFEKLTSWGFKVPNWYLSTAPFGANTPQDLLGKYQEGVRESLPYEIDGLVITLNDMAYRLSLGETDDRPVGSTAYKFAPVCRETTLRKIEWQVGSIGRITPVAVFDQVHLFGAKITNASIYNISAIQALGLDIGARILVARAGDVIPKVVSVVQGTGTTAAYPKVCPVCGAATVREGEYLVCPNTELCPAHVAGRIKQWIGEQNILEWGDAIIDAVVAKGLVKTVADLYRLTKLQLMGLDRMGGRSAEVVWDTLHACEEVPLERFLGGLSIPNCATSTIRFCMDAGLDTLVALRSASMEQLQRVPGLGPVKALALHTWLREKVALVDDLLTVVKIKEKVLGALTGCKIAITGATKTKRSVLELFIADSGGEYKSSVSKTCTHLVIADIQSTSVKAQAARKMGIKLIDEESLLKLQL